MNSYGSTFEGGRGFYLDPSQTNDGQNLHVVITEPLMISPLLQQLGKDEEALCHLDSFNVTMRFESNKWGRVMSLRTASTALTDLNVAFYKAPELHLNYLSVHPTIALPTTQTLPYKKHLDYVKGGTTVAPNATAEIVLDTVRLSCVPERVYLFCANARGSRDAKTSDSFLCIDGVSVTFENKTGLLGSCSPQDLYSMSVNNGCNLTYPEFTNFRGSVLCIDFSRDLGLAEGYAPGVRGNYSVQITLRVRNSSSANFTYEAWQSFVLPGTFEIMPGAARANVGNLSEVDVLTATESVGYYDVYPGAVYGGSFWGSLKHIVNKGARFVQKAIPIAQDVAKVIPGVGSQASKYIGMAGQAAGVARSLTGGQLSSGGALNTGGGVMLRYKRK